MNAEFTEWLNKQEYRHSTYCGWFIDGVIKRGKVSIITWEWSEITYNWGKVINES